MKIRKVFTGKITYNTRYVQNNENGQHITETSKVELEGLREGGVWDKTLQVDGLLPVGTKFTLTLEEVEE
jgi:hypothetical protein